MRSLPLLSTALLLSTPALAQDTTATPASTRLQPVRVTVTRDAARSPLDLPFAVSIVRPDSMRPGQRHAGLDETLFQLPGVAVANRNNPAQDPRISIRGFGARSAFGVRGVRVLRDGIPLTLPDGQTPVDYLDLESVGTIEVIRGAASALYGNASGGVIDIHTREAPLAPLAGELRGWRQDYRADLGRPAREANRLVGVAGGTVGGLRYQGNVTHSLSDGWRDYARQRLTSGFGRVAGQLGATSLSLQGTLFGMPLAENPGALTASQLATDPRQADPSSIANRARKAVHQGQFGLVASRPLAGGDLTATAYGGWRSLYNPLAQAVVDVDRASGGASVRGTAPLRLLGVTHLLTAGADAQWQNDDRKNFANCNAVATPNASCPRARTDSGVVRLDQRETIASIGPFVRDEIAFGGRYRATVGVRADQIRFRVADRLIVPPTNPDDSGERTLSAVSPVVGVVARLGLLHAAYANISSSFETPTTTELANKENGSAGINPSLQPQYARTYETGLKGFVLARVQYDVAAFLTPVRNELVLFQVPGGNGRTYYRNAGRTRREGAEAALSSAAGPIELGASYSFSRFRFTDYRVTTTTGTGATATTTTTSYAGRAIPGIPRHQLQGSITWRAHRAFATAEGIAYGFVYVNDANSAGAKRYQLLNARAGGTALFGRPWLSPIVGIQNLLDRRYAASVAVNAIGGKYYEPGTGRTVYAGLSAGIGR